MLPIDFEGTNVILTKPKDWTDEQCMEIKAFRGVDAEGIPFFLTAWNLSKEDLEAVNEGRPIMLKVCGSVTPPVAMYTFDKNYNPNT
ncbi:MAG TPA: hypothetical protein VMY77_14470 [Chitinophagaceae bacterium]|nr:hypothetical protein [Chitinophagaceae bacterium]